MVAVDSKTRMAIELVLQDLASKDLKQFDRLVGRTAKSGEKSFGRMGRAVLFTNKHLTQMIVLMGAAAAALVALKIRKGTTDFLEFGEAMASVRTVFSGTVKEFKQSGELVKEISLSLGIDEIEVALGLYQTLSSDVTDTAEAILVLNTAAELGIAGNATTAESVNLLTGQLKAFGIEINAKTLKALADLNFATTKLGKIRIPELAANMSKTALFANNLGVSLEEMNAVVATLTQGSLSAAQSFTGLTAVLRGLIKAGPEATKLLKDAGIESATAALKSEGFAAVMQKLRDKYEGNTDALKILFPETEAIGVAMALTGEQGDLFVKTLRQLGDVAGQAGVALKQQLDAPARRLKILLTGLDQGFQDIAESMFLSFVDGTTDIEGVREAANRLRQDVVALEFPVRVIGTLFLAWLSGVTAIATVAVTIGHIFGAVAEEDMEKVATALIGITELTNAMSADLLSGRKTSKEQNDEYEKQRMNLAEILALQGKIAETIVSAPPLPTGDEDETNTKIKTFVDGWKKGWDEIQTHLTDNMLGQEAAFQAFGALESGLDRFTKDLVEGEADFKSFAKTLIKELIAIGLKLLILRGIRGFLPGASGGGTLDSSGFSDGGNDFAAGGIMTRKGPLNLRHYAQGGIADRPQLAVFGEGNSAGGEAFVPLGPSRKIGVELRGDALPGETRGATVVNLNVTSIDPKGAAAIILEQERPILKMIASAIAGGRDRGLVTSIRTVARGGV